MIFTDAHSGSAVCTPTRYGILTGRYDWRSRLKSGVLGGLSPRLIEPGRLTVAIVAQGRRAITPPASANGTSAWTGSKLPGKDVTELNIETPEQVHNVDYTQADRERADAASASTTTSASARRSTWCRTRSSRTTA